MLDKSVYLNIDNLIEFDSDLRSAVIKAMNNKYLSMHKSAVWFDEGKKLHCTKLGGKNKTSKTLDGLNKKIIEYYKNFDLSFHTVMSEQLDNNLKLKSIVQSTYDRYINDYDRYVKGSELDKTPVTEITAKQIRTFLETKIVNGISKKNFDNLIGLLNVVYFYSEMTSINVSNIKKLMKLKTKQFDKSNKRQTAEIAWTDEEQEKLITYSKAHKDIRVLGMIFMLQTGLAISELTQLHKADVDVQNRELTIHRIEIKYKKNGKTVYDVSEEYSAKTENRLETMLLSQKALQTYKEILELSNARSEHDRIFNGYWSYSFNDYLRRHVLVDLGLTPRGLHSFRKTYATNLVDSGVEFKTIQEQMRHSDIQTTMKFYYKSKSTKEKKLEALDQVS
ncbi:tyrosine-type recombinase/integrase [Enterocloster citroniae]|uniref:tyrosine-type recombinase/integrase n=1 Tax=Enterocloster citroniae TaxID=358743 RepID=UPI001D097434|nr:tyrosine-type recombinase/integrase [Enterocloster citroniae]MCB7067685.1 tyrosine-type recombinase/integrase [Enterocloster citroniae]